MTKPGSGLDPDPALRPYMRIQKNDVQCCWSVTFWYGSGSRSMDPYLWLTEPDPKPAIVVSDLQGKKKFDICLLFTYFFEVTFTSFSKKKKTHKKSKNRRSQGFSYYFWLMIEGSGSVPLTNGSGRPQNKRVLWIQICGRLTIFDWW